MKETNHTSMLWRIQKQPKKAVDGVLSGVPESVLLDCSKKVADLAMGDGSYLAEVARRRVANGATPEEAQKTLYGFESSSVYLVAARRLSGLQNAHMVIINPSRDLDLLSMEFDIVIGNPPYQDSSNCAKNNKLWMKFVFSGLKLLKRGGYLSIITPNSFVGRTLQPAKIRTLLSTEYSLISVDHNANNYFKVGVSICQWLAKKASYEGTTLVTEGENTRTIDLRGELPLVEGSQIKDSIAEKINSIVKRPETATLPTTLEEFDFIPSTSGKHKVYTSGRNKFYLTDTVSDKRGRWKVAFSFSATYKGWFVTQDDVAGFNRMVYVSSPDEGVEIGNTLLHPVMSFYLDTWRKTAGFTPAIKNQHCLPDIRGLTDDEVRAKFELTDEEYEYIQSNHQPYKSMPRIL